MQLQTKRFWRNIVFAGTILFLGILNLVFITVYWIDVTLIVRSMTANKRSTWRGRFPGLLQSGTVNMAYFWGSVRQLVKGDTLYPEDFDVTTVIKALRNAKIVHADVFQHATSLKWLLTLDGGQKAIFKIKTQKKLGTLNQCNYGCEHPEYEVVGFTINRMFDLRNMAFVSGRRVSWFKEIYPVATPELRKFIQRMDGNRTCFSWKCWNTHKTSEFCFDNGEITGAMLYYLEGHDIEKIESRKSVYHRYHLYGIDDERNLDLQSGDKRFCNKFRQESPYNHDSWFLDIIDIAIIDFIMSHDDSRHTYIGDIHKVDGDNKPDSDTDKEDESRTIRNKTEITNRKTKLLVERKGMKEEITNPREPLLNVIFDYGAAFCEFDHIKILAPLIQCCRIRTRLYNAMARLRKTFKETFNEYTRDDPLYPLLLPWILDDMIKKFEKALASVELCFKLDGKSNVLIEK